MIFYSFLYVFFTLCISYDIVGPIRVCEDWEWEFPLKQEEKWQASH